MTVRCFSRLREDVTSISEYVGVDILFELYFTFFNLLYFIECIWGVYILKCVYLLYDVSRNSEICSA